MSRANAEPRIAPASFAQERLCFLDRLQPGSASYNVTTAWRMSGDLDVAALERALGEIVRRHEALRTGFSEVDGRPQQVIELFPYFSLSVELLGGAVDDRDAAIQDWASKHVRLPFDLNVAPLFRARLLQVSPTEHVLLLSFHHAVCDAWSLNVLTRELSLLYAAFRRNADSPLAEARLQPSDYAIWQRDALPDERMAASLAYWTSRLADAPPLLELPTDRPRPSVASDHGAQAHIELPASLLHGLRALGRHEGSTLYMLLLAAFQVLLGKYSGCDDIVVGTPIAGRTRPEFEDLVGLLVNTLVLRTDLSGDPTFRDVLKRVRARALDAYKHMDVPFERLVAELQPARTLSHTPLFQVLFQVHETARRSLEMPGLRVQRLTLPIDSAKFDLALEMTASADGLRGVMTYRTDLFDSQTVERMLANLALLLEDVVANAGVRLSKLQVPGTRERRTLLREWSRSASAFASEQPLHALIEGWSRAHPNERAVEFESGALTYAALNARANQLARYLRERGVQRHTRVGICVDRTPEMVVALLAVMKAGGSYLPLEPALPRQRVASMIWDAGVGVVISEDRFRDLLPAAYGPIVWLDRDRDAIAACRTQNLHSQTGAADLAYVIYTSGSTGVPKGVAVTHGAVANTLHDMRERLHVSPSSRIFAMSSLCFDVAALEIWLPLTTGATCCLAGTTLRAGVRTVKDLERSGSVIVQSTPSGWRALLDQGWRPGGPVTALSAGEPLSPTLARELLEACGSVWNLYGPTEAAIYATAHRLDGRGDRVPIGRPIAGAQTYVLDACLQPVPIGAVGELCIGGAGLAQGYWQRPGLTASAFVPDPYGAPGQRLYRTGDRVRYDADGLLEFVGRRDHQVKIRGFRIELGEIEAALAEQPGVRAAVVDARSDRPGDPRLVAYVVPDGGVPADTRARSEALRHHLRERLPDYMVPAAIVWLSVLPLTATGKINRTLLPAPPIDHAPPPDRPRTAAEERLTAIWREVLGASDISPADHFFELGGHSLAALEVAYRVYRDFGIELPVHIMFERPVLSEMAEYLDACAGSVTTVEGGGREPVRA